MRYVIALGGNLGNPEETFVRTIQRLQQVFAGSIEVATAYWTKPLIHPDAPVRQRPYLNTVAAFESDLEPEQVLENLFEIECSLGRVRANEQIPWGPRTIDLDLIAAEDLIRSTDSLTLPHPEMQKRDFVLVPMAEIAPEWVHPVLKKNVHELIEELDETWIVEPLMTSEQGRRVSGTLAG